MNLEKDMLIKIKKIFKFCELLERYEEKKFNIVNNKLNLLGQCNLLDETRKKNLLKKFRNFIVDDIPLYDYFIEGKFNGLCYAGSLLSLLAFNKNDLLCRGILDLNGDYNYEHGWVEFFENGQHLILDTTFIGIYAKNDYYKIFKPIDSIKISKKDLISIYFNQNYGNLLGNKIDFFEFNEDNDFLHIQNFLRGQIVFNKNKIYSLNSRIYK